jgi:hypothetical protein
MKSLTIHTLLVPLALTLCGAGSLAAMELPNPLVSQSEQKTIAAPAVTHGTALYAMNALDTESLTSQEMTDEELKAVEGAAGMVEYIAEVLIALIAVAPRMP